jgi:hypothetical protein
MRTSLVSLLHVCVVACTLAGAAHSSTAVHPTVISGSGNFSPETKKWTWTKATFVPCENFGVNGTYTVTAEAKVESVPGGRRITSVDLWIFSASLANGPATVGARLVVKKDNTELKRVDLIRPGADESVLERTPEPNESKSVYLPRNTVVTVPTGAKIVFTVTVSVQTPAGSCSLPSSEKEIDPYAR